MRILLVGVREELEGEEEGLEVEVRLDVLDILCLVRWEFSVLMLTDSNGLWLGSLGDSCSRGGEFCCCCSCVNVLKEA